MTPPVPPAPIEVGAPLNKFTINQQLGEAARGFKRGLEDLETFEEWQRGLDVPALVALGYTADEANLLKSALAEVPSVTAVVDALQFLHRLWGTGV